MPAVMCQSDASRHKSWTNNYWITNLHKKLLLLLLLLLMPFPLPN